jgi:hypothetical protein
MTRLGSYPVRWLSRLVSFALAPASQITLVLIAVVTLFTAGAPRSGEAGAVPSNAGLVSARTLLTSPGACPFTPSQEREIVSKFDKLWPVVRHPRCLNCHGGVNPYVEEDEGGHLGGKITKGSDLRETLNTCQECHSGLEGWDIPVDAMYFTGKSSQELCILFKKTERTPADFVAHITNDKGRVPFTVTAFKGDRALNEAAKDITEEKTGRPFQVEPPPMSQEAMIELSRDWAEAMGPGWAVKPACGCGRGGRGWTGTVTGVWNLDLAEMGHATETTTANVRFEIDSSFAGDSAVYWKSTSGEIKWTTRIFGAECRASASGTVPIGLGADLNPMAMLSQQNVDVPRFMVAIGPWPDAYVPRFVIRCKDSPPIPGVLFGGHLWWYHAPAGILSADGKTLKGTYEAPAPIPGTMKWTWDLQMEEPGDAADR